MGRSDSTLEVLTQDRGPELVAYATLITGGDRAAAQDLVQEAIVRVFARIRNGFTPDVAEAYVRRAIVNIYIDSSRKRRGFADRFHLLAGAQTVSVSDAAEALDVRAALRTLGPQERAAVVLRYYEDLTVPEVADRMGLAEGTVKRYLSNALHKLETRLGPATPPGVEADVVPVSGPHHTGSTRPERSGR